MGLPPAFVRNSESTPRMPITLHISLVPITKFRQIDKDFFQQPMSYVAVLASLAPFIIPLMRYVLDVCP